MKFTEKNKIQLSLLGGWINYTDSEFEIITNKDLSPKEIIDNFVKNEQDFLPAKKYKDGLIWNHRDENGIEKTHKLKMFGLYEREKLDLNDYKEVKFQTLNKEIFKFINAIEKDNPNNHELQKKINSIKLSMQRINKENTNHFILKSTEENIPELNPFDRNDYLCGFSVNMKTNILNVIQIDDD